MGVGDGGKHEEARRYHSSAGNTEDIPEIKLGMGAHSVKIIPYFQ